MKPRLLVSILFAASAAIALPSCSDNPAGSTCGDGTTLNDNGECVADAVCGAGTTLENGMCVPSSNVACGAGTIAVGDECVPDGTMICEQGTVYDATVGGCVLDPTACAEGTVLVGDQCVNEDDAITADTEEAAEPNETTGAGMFAIPAIGEQRVIHGCITPKAGGIADEDIWIMTATGPSVVEITADGVHGLAAGFAVVDGAQNPLLDSWQRLGINLTGDTSKRQVYLPAAGTYLLVMDDSRSLIFGGEAAGSADTCYFTTIKQVALPAATALGIPQTTGTDEGNVRVLTFNASATADIVDVTVNTGSGSMSPSFVVLRNNILQGVASGDASFWTVGGLDTTNDTVTFVYDAEYNYGVVPQAYTLDNFRIASPQLTSGTPVTVTSLNGSIPTAPWWEQNFLYFDVGAAGQIVHLNITSTQAIQMRLVRRDVFDPLGAYQTVAVLDATSTGTMTFQNQFVRFLNAGRYYLVAFDPNAAVNDMYTITATLTNVAAPAVTYGTPMTAQPLTNTSSFYTYDPAAPQEWAQFGVTATGFGGTTARVSLYDAAREGLIGSTAYPAVQTGTQNVDGSAPSGRIVLGEARTFLVRVADTGTSGATPTFTLDVSERPHVNLGALPSGGSMNRTGMDTLAGGATQRYLITGTTGERLRLTATPVATTNDIRIDFRNVDETIPTGGSTNTGGVGVAESTSKVFPAIPPYIAFSVTNSTTALSTGVNFAFTSTAPIPYADICATGTLLNGPFATGAADDEYSTVQTLPAGTWNFYGLPQTEFIVAANGFIVFGNTAPTCSFGCFSNGTLPSTTQPNNMIAAHWEDHEGLTACRKDDLVAQTVTIQWSGRIYGASTTVQFQSVLHANGTVDLIYGPSHLATGSSATTGVENATGTQATLISFNTAGSIAPNTSQTVSTP